MSARTGLVPAVLALGSNLGTMLEHEEKAWNSPTFTGARHTITLEFKGEPQAEAGERYIELLPDHEFNLAGHKVCSATIKRVHYGPLPEPRLEVEAELLLLEEG